MASVRVYQKKQLRLDLLNFKQQQVYELGNVGLAAVKERLAAGRGPDDGPAKPLAEAYKKYKLRRGGSDKRDLKFSGAMLENLKIRVVSERHARAGVTTRKARIRAWANQQREAWLVFSPINLETITEHGRQMIEAMKRTLAVERFLGGRQR